MVSKKRFNSILFAFILHGAMFQPELSRYLEECSSTLATTYSSGTPGQDASIVTVDQVGRVDENDNVNNGDSKTFESWV